MNNILFKPTDKAVGLPTCNPFMTGSDAPVHVLPSLISLVASVDVKQHVYLLTYILTYLLTYQFRWSYRTCSETNSPPA